MGKIRKLHHDMKCLEERIKQTHHYYIPRLQESIRWLAYFNEELLKCGIETDFRHQLGFNCDAVLVKETSKLAHAEEVLENLRVGRIRQNQQGVLDEAYYSLEGQQTRIDNYVSMIDYAKYDLEKEHGHIVNKAAARADIKCGTYSYYGSIYSEIIFEDLLEKLLH